MYASNGLTIKCRKYTYQSSVELSTASHAAPSLYISPLHLPSNPPCTSRHSFPSLPILECPSFASILLTLASLFYTSSPAHNLHTPSIEKYSGTGKKPGQGVYAAFCLQSSCFPKREGGWTGTAVNLIPGPTLIKKPFYLLESLLTKDLTERLCH
jgi:hypothetical protein